VVSSFEKFQTEPPAKLRNNGMSDGPKKRSRAWIRSALIATLLLAYPLSIGPAYRYWGFSAFEVQTLNTAYAPVWWLWRVSEPARKAINWYVGLWVPAMR
jgi:hypothetical protein